MASGPTPLNATYRKCRPSGRKDGNACRVSPNFASIAVTGDGLPPDAGKRSRGVPLSGENRITSPWFHVPGKKPEGASPTVNVGPPEASILLSLPPAKNPMYRLSGDQNGAIAPSVPAS